MKTENQLPATITQMISPFNEGEFKEKFQVALKDHFAGFETKANELATTASTITVNNADELSIARQRILDISTWVKNLTAKHKECKDPLFTLTKMMDTKKKSLEEKFEASKDTITKKITFWETVEKRKAATELLELKERNREKNALIVADTLRIDRMVSNIRAMLYGGDVINSQGSFPKKGCFTIEEAEDVERVVSANIPGPEKFHTECFSIYQNATRLITEMITARKNSLLTTSGTVLSDVEAAIISETTTIVADQDRQSKAVEKSFDKQIENTEKGFRRDIKWEVFDINKVPREYLTIDSEKLNNYKVEHRDEILEALKADHSVTNAPPNFIAGIKFSVEQKSIVR